METKILKRMPKTSAVYLREAITAAFFYPPPVHQAVDGLREVFDRYLKMIPSGALTWASIGANSESWSPVGKTTFSRCLAQLEPARAKARPMTAFELTDGAVGGEAPGYGFALEGSPAPDPYFPGDLNLVQMSLPMEALEAATADAVVAFLRGIAELVPMVSGYASPGLQWSMQYRAEAMKEARPLAARHPGYDVQFNQVGRALGKRVRGARWLTFLDSELTSTLGGIARLRGALSQAIAVEPLASGGVMIRAGHLPELGDVNKGVAVPLLREVAAVLEPITTFAEPMLLANFAEHDATFFERWQRRFLD